MEEADVTESAFTVDADYLARGYVGGTIHAMGRWPREFRELVKAGDVDDVAAWLRAHPETNTH